MKKIIIAIVGIVMSAFMYTSTTFAVPTFGQDFKTRILTDTNGKNETVFNPNSFQISANNTLQQNIYNLFAPANNSSVIWNVIRIIMIGVLVLYFAWTGIDFILNPNDAGKLKAAQRSFYYMLFGAFLIYGVTWILGKALQIDVVQGSQGFLTSLTGRVLFQIMSFLKAFAFFYAIVMTIWHGIGMVRALDKEDAIKSAKTGIINIVIALIIIKVIDFIFFIAQDVAFASRAKQFMLNLARVIGYILGSIMVLSLIYAGFQYISAQGDEGKVKSAKTTVANIFYVILVIFMFLLVAWQIIAEFA